MCAQRTARVGGGGRAHACACVAPPRTAAPRRCKKTPAVVGGPKTTALRGGRTTCTRRGRHSWMVTSRRLLLEPLWIDRDACSQVSAHTQRRGGETWFLRTGCRVKVSPATPVRGSYQPPPSASVRSERAQNRETKSVGVTARKCANDDLKFCVGTPHESG